MTATTTTLITLHHNYNSLRYNYNYSCSTSHYIQQLWVRWPLQPLQPLQQTQLQPPFGQSVDSLCHPWFTTTNVSYRFPILKLPPPPCAVLLVSCSLLFPICSLDISTGIPVYPRYTVTAIYGYKVMASGQSRTRGPGSACPCSSPPAARTLVDNFHGEDWILIGMGSGLFPQLSLVKKTRITELFSQFK